MSDILKQVEIAELIGRLIGDVRTIKRYIRLKDREADLGGRELPSDASIHSQIFRMFPVSVTSLVDDSTYFGRQVTATSSPPWTVNGNFPNGFNIDVPTGGTLPEVGDVVPVFFTGVYTPVGGGDLQGRFLSGAPGGAAQEVNFFAYWDAGLRGFAGGTGTSSYGWTNLAFDFSTSVGSVSLVTSPSNIEVTPAGRYEVTYGVNLWILGIFAAFRMTRNGSEIVGSESTVHHTGSNAHMQHVSQTFLTDVSSGDVLRVQFSSKPTTGSHGFLFTATDLFGIASALEPEFDTDVTLTVALKRIGAASA